MLKPDYDNSIVNLMASLRLGLGGGAEGHPPLAQLPPAEVAAARNVVLLVIDGLGYEYLQAHDTRLGRWLRGPLSSVFPSSTAPAITSFMTGTAPRQHAITGWFMYLRELGLVSTILPFRSRSGGMALNRLGLDPVEVIGAGSQFDRLAVEGDYLIGRDLVNSAYSLAMAGAARRWDYRDLAECCRRLHQLALGRRRFVYAYWPRLDALAHEYGVGSVPVAEHLRQLDRHLDALIADLRGSGTLLLITADHGFIDTTPASVIRLEQHPELRDMLLLPLCGEPRAAFCYLQAGCQDRFERYVTTVLGDAFELHRSEDLIRQGWFGHGEPHPRLRQRLGEYVLLGRDNHVIVERLPGESDWSLIGVHGGASRAEMLVPLLVVQC